jgi:hypothetical protein
MEASTKAGIGFVIVGFFVGFFDRQLFGLDGNGFRLGTILVLGFACFVTMFLLSRRDRRRR